MKLDTQRRIAASLLKCGIERVRFEPARLADIKEGITKSDMRLLISDHVVYAEPVKGISRVRARKIRVQKRKGLRRGDGSHKGRGTIVQGSKAAWMAKVRAQRDLIAELKEKKLVSPESYKILYRKAKGGFFRSRRHIKLFIDDKRLWLTAAAAQAVKVEAVKAEDVKVDKPKAARRPRAKGSDAEKKQDE